MLSKGFLIAIFVAFSIPTFWYILRRDDVFGIAYLFLFVYTIFTQIGYAFFPYLSASKNIYYGEKMFYDYWLFMFLSFFLSFSIYALFTSKYLRRCRGHEVSALGFQGRHVFSAIWFATTAYLLIEYANVREQLHYAMNGSELAGRIFTLVTILRCYEVMVVVMYAQWRVFQVRGRRRRYPCLGVLVGCLVIIGIAAKMGSRSDILYMASALLVLELHPLASTLKQRWRRVAAVIPVVLLLLYGLSVLEAVRVKYSMIDSAALAEVATDPALALGLKGAGLEGLLARDFYWPSHLLMTAMYYDIVDPVEVMKSNLENSAVGLRYPTLSQTTARQAIGSVERVARVGGFAFHQFIEGYIAMGWMGVIYNAIMWNAGLLCWRVLTQTRDPLLNRATVGLLAYFVPSMMRGQSSIYVNWAIFWLLPAMALLFLATNRRPGGVRRSVAPEPFRCAPVSLPREEAC